MTNPQMQAWELINPVRQDPDNYNDAWRDARSSAKKYAEKNRLSKTAFAKEVGIASSTFSEWWSGKYKGDCKPLTLKVQQYVDNQADLARVSKIVPDDLGFIETPTANKVIQALQYAQSMPEMVTCSLGAGMGKTSAATNYKDSNSHVFLATMRPTTKTPTAMLRVLAKTVGVGYTTISATEDRIGEAVKRNGRKPLIIIDEAQNLNDDAVNELRYFLDEYGCGIALIGNQEIYTRFGGTTPSPAYAQIHRRIGLRLHQMKPVVEDIRAIIEGWEIENSEAEQLLLTIGKRPGALGGVSKTVRLAHMLATGSGASSINADHIRAAWSNRGGQEL